MSSGFNAFVSGTTSKPGQLGYAHYLSTRRYSAMTFRAASTEAGKPSRLRRLVAEISHVLHVPGLGPTSLPIGTEGLASVARSYAHRPWTYSGRHKEPDEAFAPAQGRNDGL